MSEVLQLFATADAAVPQLLSVPACLRALADRIESGEIGQCLRAAVVLRCVDREPIVAGAGQTNITQTFMDLHAGALELMSMKRPERI